MHAGLAAGAALAALPVILHLFMRQTPKHIIFPALRLIQERQRRSKKRLRVKNWLLLLARMLLIALMALALARPRLYTQIPLGDESVPTALGLVMDTSLSMNYKDRDKTRLDEAKERAREIIGKLPDSSLVFVVDSADPGVPFGLTPAAALQRVDSLVVRAVNRPLNAAMGQVYTAVAECDRPVHVVYVLTDLSRTSWVIDKPADGLDRVSKIKENKNAKMATFVLRVTPEVIQNVTVEKAEIFPSVAIQGSPVEVHAQIRSEGPKSSTRVAEFYLDGTKKGEKTVELPASGTVAVNFTVPTQLLAGELHRGSIKLTGAPDPFQEDDERFFTFKMQPAVKVLVVSDSGGEDVRYVLDALETSNPGEPGSFQVERLTTAEFMIRPKDGLSNYGCVFLLNVAKLDESDWGALNGYVHQGGGLVVAPGHLAKPENYTGPITNQFMPAQLTEPKPPYPGLLKTTFGKILDKTHPLFESMGKDLDAALSQAPVYRYWSVKPVGEGSRTLLTYADGAPALIERTFAGPKTGRVLMWTTPLSSRARSNDRAAWNDFPIPTNGFSFFILMNLTVPYLAGTTGDQLIYEAGDNVSLALKPGVHFTSFAVSNLGDKAREESLPAGNGDSLEILAPQSVGQWAVKAIAADNKSAELGFSLNPPRAESQFRPLEKTDLDIIFGADGYVLAQDVQAYRTAERVSRFGYEAFPWLMLLILIVVTLENFLANNFYKEAPRATPTAA